MNLEAELVTSHNLTWLTWKKNREGAENHTRDLCLRNECDDRHYNTGL